MTFKLCSLMLALLMLVMPVLAQVDEVQQATADATKAAEQDVSMIAWGLGGFFCTGFALSYAFLSTPQVPGHQLIGKSSVYVNTYTTVYKENVKSKRKSATTVGCLIGVGVVVIANLSLQND